MRSFLLGGTAALFCLGAVSAAVAADIVHDPAATSQVSVAPVYDWTGLRLGFHLGHAWNDFDLAWHGTPDQEPNGWFAGGQIGYDVQTSTNIVLGLAVDLSLGSLEDEVPDGNFIRQRTEIDAFGTARARLGYAFDFWLPYITGGMAWARGGTGGTCPAEASAGHCKTNGAYDEFADFTAVGWTAGAGVEIALTESWSLKAEYLHMNFGGDLHVLGMLSNPREADLSMDIGRIGLNYRFGQ